MNLPNVIDLNKVDQTTNLFFINKADSANLVTNFTEYNDTNLPNVTDLKKILIKLSMTFPSTMQIHPT